MPTGTRPLRAGIYVRISSDPSEERAGVQRQEKDCRELARRRGWKVARVYEDNDLSAWNGKPRPQYEELLHDIRSGVLDAVLVWHLDRLHRTPRELEEFIDLCQDVGLSNVATVTGDLDIDNSDGLFQARILVAVGRKSSDDSSRRIRRKMEDIAIEGRPSGGGKRPYGYEKDGVSIRKDEAKVIREAARRVERGEGLLTIANDLNTRGVETVSGGPWSTRTLKRILTQPRWAGLREHKGTVIGDAAWPGILKQDQHHRLRAILLDGSRSNGGTTARKYLLVGFCYCGPCSTRLVSRSRGRTGSRSYQCSSMPPYQGCGRLSILAGPMEDLVRDAIFQALDGPRLAKVVRSMNGYDKAQAELTKSLRDDEAALEQLAVDHYSAKLISRAEFLAARRDIETRIENSRARLSRSTDAGVLAALPSGGALRQAWDSKGLDWRRSVISAVLDRIVVAPATIRGRNRFDPTRVELIWKV